MKFIQVQMNGCTPILLNLDNVSSVTKSSNGGRALVSFIDCEDYVTLDCTYEQFIEMLCEMREVSVYGI